MNIRVLLLFGIGLFLGILSGRSQNDFKNAFIINNNNDTVFGLINLKSNSANSKECEFKTSAESESRVYTPYELKAYRIENHKFYVSKTITANETKRKVFLEFLLDGIVDLYYSSEPTDESFFIEKDSVIYQLSNKEIEIINSNVQFSPNLIKKYTVNSNQYIGILTILFTESPEIITRISNTRFELRSLINITKEYHQSVCKDYNFIDYTKSTRLKFFLEPNIGVAVARMGLTTSPDFARAVSPITGLNLRFIPVKTYYAWNILFGINYSHNHFPRHDFQNRLSQGIKKIFKIESTFELLRIPISIEYSLPLKKLQPFFSVGYSNVFILKPEYQIQVPSQEAYTTGMNWYQFGLNAGTGLRYRLSTKSYIHVKMDFEYRLQTRRYWNMPDYHFVESLIVNVAYGFSL